MAKEKFDRSKPHVNVGTIGHIDHGKTTPDRGHHEDTVEGTIRRTSSAVSIRSTTRPKRRPAESPSPPLTWNTRRRTGTTRTSIARATPITSRT